MNNKVIIIAEAGVNHNGDIDLAKKLVDAASEAGADYVKFQTFKAEKLVSKSAVKAEYQKKNIGGTDDNQYEMLKKLELSEEQHYLLVEYCKSKNIKFLSTAFDEISLDFLNALHIDFFKVPSGEITNLPYLEKICSYKKPVILSTGMTDMDEIKEAFDILIKKGIPQKNIVILHCNTEYPTPMEDVNLLAMNEIGRSFQVPVGYSDHTLGIEVPIAAVALGAVCIEKHFTLDRTMEGPDHKASLEPEELKKMVASIRNIELALGNKLKTPSASEKKNKVIARKSIHIAQPLSKGVVLKKNHLIMKRPGSGISPMNYHEVVGRTLLSDKKEDDILHWEDLE